MKAIQVKIPGGPENMELVDVPTPAPGPKQALVKIAASGVNFIDVFPSEGRRIQKQADIGEVDSSSKRPPGRSREQAGEGLSPPEEPLTASRSPCLNSGASPGVGGRRPR